jgi:hypothetical protein
MREFDDFPPADNQRIVRFLEAVRRFFEDDDVNRLRQWVGEFEEGFSVLLQTDALESIRRHTPRSDSYRSLRSLLDTILLRRYLLDSQFDALSSMLTEMGTSIPPSLVDVFGQNDASYAAHAELLKAWLTLETEHPVLVRLKTDLKQRFVRHQPFVYIPVLCEQFDDYETFVRPAIVFGISSEERAKVASMRDIFISAQSIEPRFRQMAEEIQSAMSFHQDERRYWYQLDILQSMVRNREIELSDRSAGAAIGWLAYLLEKRATIHPNIISVWGEYHIESKRLRLADGLEAKLQACRADGIRVIAVPKTALTTPTADGRFDEHAATHGIHLIPYPADAEISEVYAIILEACTELGLVDQKREPSPLNLQHGVLMKNVFGEIHWVQLKKKFYVPNFDIIRQMAEHQMPGWDELQDVEFVRRPIGPVFYRKNEHSNGLLIKVHDKPRTFLIHDAQKRRIHDEYSFENFQYRDQFLDWLDVIAATDEIVNDEFPTGVPIVVTPTLESPETGATLDANRVELRCQRHVNPSWTYRIQIAQDPDFTSIFRDQTQLDPTLTVDELAPGRYFWRMRGRKEDKRDSLWSDVWTFTVES